MLCMHIRICFHRINTYRYTYIKTPDLLVDTAVYLKPKEEMLATH